MFKVTVEDFIKNCNVDIDVTTNISDTYTIAFCGWGETQLTEEGKKHFASTLKKEIQFKINGTYAFLQTTEQDEEKDMKLFYALAGYCTPIQTALWFKE